MFAYLLFELIPEGLGSYHGQRTVRRVGDIIDAEKAYRALHDEVEIAPTVENLMRLAEGCVRLGKFGEVVPIYRRCLQGMHQGEPHLMIGLANALFGAGDAAGAKTTLDELRVANPSLQSAEVHLHYACSLEALGDAAGARREYDSLVGYFPWPEASCRYALYPQRQGDEVRTKASLPTSSGAANARLATCGACTANGMKSPRATPDIALGCRNYLPTA